MTPERSLLSLLIIPIETRQIILRHVFEGSVVSARFEPRNSGTAQCGSTETNESGSSASDSDDSLFDKVAEGVTVCVTRCDWPSVLHANKQLLNEGYALFHHIARLTLKSGWATGYWSACWSRGKIDNFMGWKCLQMIRDIEVDSPFTRTSNQ